MQLGKSLVPQRLSSVRLAPVLPQHHSLPTRLGERQAGRAGNLRLRRAALRAADPLAATHTVRVRPRWATTLRAKTLRARRMEMCAVEDGGGAAATSKAADRGRRPRQGAQS
eukprot:6204241-Pleurochrysis_carterae.AAC.2